MARILINRDITTEEDRALEIRGLTPTSIAVQVTNYMNILLESAVNSAKQKATANTSLTELETAIT